MKSFKQAASLVLTLGVMSSLTGLAQTNAPAQTHNAPTHQAQNQPDAGQEQPSATENPNWDTGKNHIQRATESGLMAGYPDGQFHPEKELTRAQLAHILVKAFNLSSRQPQNFDESAMSDVPQTHWAYEDIRTVLRNNVMEGYRPMRFYPEQKVTRAEAFAIFAQAYGVFQFQPHMVEEELAQYKDAKAIPSWATKAMATALHEGFVNTDEQAGYIYPEKMMTRGDMAYALSKYLERVYKPDHPVYKK